MSKDADGRMIKVNKEEMKNIARLFSGIGDSMVTACIQGYMGDAYVDKLPEPEVGVIISGEYSFFAGDTKNPKAYDLVNGLFDISRSRKTVCIFPEEEPQWEQLLMSVKKNDPKIVTRYGIVQKDYDFDPERLGYFMKRLPKGYDLVPFDEDLYDQAMKEEWAEEFCKVFSSAEDFLTRGFGYAITKDGKLVSGTSTMTVYDGGAEVQMATHPDYRKQGLAMVCAAAFLLESRRRKIRACWDAENEISKKIAIALGYEYRGEYTTIHMRDPEA